MLTPAVIDEGEYAQCVPSRLGDVVTWYLGWVPTNPWSEVGAGWSMTAEVRAADRPPRTSTGPSPEDRTVEQECIGSHGGVQLTFASALPIPESATVTGALQVRAGTVGPGMAMRGRWGPADEGALTTGTVRRLRAVSIVHAPRSVPGSRVRTNRLVPGSEWVYEMAEPPDQLHNYELVPNDFGAKRRSEFLVVDL